jgi:hypothetical protein
MRLRTATGLVCLIAILGLVACGSGHSSPLGTPNTSTTTTPSSVTTSTTPTITSITISSSTGSGSLPLGTTTQLSTTDSNNQSCTATWTTSNPSVATVSSSGLVTAVGIGTAVITGTCGSISQTITITVTPAVAVQVNLTPASTSIATSQTVQFTANALFSDGSTQDVTKQASWSSSNANINFLSPGLAFGTVATNGAATITATMSGVSGTASLNVSTATLASIAVSPDAATIPTGANQQFSAAGTWTDSSTQDVTTNPVVTWSSDNTSVASVGANTGFALGLTAGTANITASASGATSDTSQLTVTPGTLTGITVTPVNPSIPTFLTQQFTAMGTFSDGSYLDISATVNWSSSNTSVATIAAGGLATPVSSGNTNITASYSGITSAASTLTVTGGHLVFIVVTPVHSGATVGAGATVQFSATGKFDDGSVSDITSFVTWTSSNANVATISAAGVASTGSTGQSTITASLAGVTGSAVLTVTQASLSKVVILPAGINPTTLSLDGQGLPIQPDLAMGYRTRMTLVSWGYYTDQTFHILTGTIYTSPDNSRS